MNDTAEVITPLRDQIDTIDDEIIRLLKERTAIVAKVGAQKRAAGETGTFIRPGREGAMHRRIHEAFQGSDFDPNAALAIWRLIISASTNLESPMKLAVTQSRDEPGYHTLAREYFGSFLDAKSYSSSGSLLSDLYDGKANIGILPYPLDEHHWWLLLPQYSTDKLYIFAKLPLDAAFPDQRAALAVADVMPEQSGEQTDESYYVARMEENISTSSIHTAFAKANLKPTIINAAPQPPFRCALLKLDGFYPDDDPAIQTVRSQLDQADLYWIGSHPKSISGA